MQRLVRSTDVDMNVETAFSFGAVGAKHAMRKSMKMGLHVEPGRP